MEHLYIITRITNGRKEMVLDDQGSLLSFTEIEDAKSYLSENGLIENPEYDISQYNKANSSLLQK